MPLTPEVPRTARIEKCRAGWAVVVPAQHVDRIVAIYGTRAEANADAAIRVGA